MDVFESIKRLIVSNEPRSKAPGGFCPNCWGNQEYGGKFYEAIKNENVNIDTLSSKKGWIQEYADKHLGTIELKHEDDMLVCQKCKIAYRPS